MFKLPDLSYPYDALEPHIDAQTMKIHHGKHHAGYVEKLNRALASREEFLDASLTELFKKIDKLPHEIKTALTKAGGGHYNHTLFWQIMTPNPSKPSGGIAKALKRQFGNLDKFIENFSAVGEQVFGSGWVWLATDDKGHLCVCASANQENPLMPGRFKCANCQKNCRPILGLDVWEHSYYLKYQNRRADYIKAWWRVVNWERVGQLYENQEDIT